jgi:hypothetical protein
VDHGTFECRLHSGTLDPIKVTSWVMALLYFFHEAKNAPCTISPESETRAALIAFFRFTKMPLHLRKHLIIRARKFAHVTLSHKPRKRTLSSFLSSTIPLDPPAISTRTPWIITTDPLEHP